MLQDSIPPFLKMVKVFKSCSQMRHIACEVMERISLKFSKFMRTVHYGTWEKYITHIPKYSIYGNSALHTEFLGCGITSCV